MLITVMLQSPLGVPEEAPHGYLYFYFVSVFKHNSDFNLVQWEYAVHSTQLHKQAKQTL